MAYVVTEGCINCKQMDCVEVCPVDCFREGPNMLVIDPNECVDCTLCVPACPEKAIFRDGDVPVEQHQFVALNEEMAEVWELIDEKGDVPADASDWSGRVGKFEFLQR
ncbi:ferredoxin family protein [Pseudomaricurvus alkylphenolicus]|jgi:ferredoxin|uniref:ferredoxin FdxA n=1 Tax=Pseudomaricurvus alkylphenolicus TaxID=1306991 RepID=UPI0014248FE3|nr:ferredoxin FdxA [Pseudomaricurvus alkylphenolicus]NIB42273.1 ferredoxin family protein [Pseudomaricurvus alkylphenolicus]